MNDRTWITIHFTSGSTSKLFKAKISLFRALAAKRPSGTQWSDWQPPYSLRLRASPMGVCRLQSIISVGWVSARVCRARVLRNRPLHALLQLEVELRTHPQSLSRVLSAAACAPVNKDTVMKCLYLYIMHILCCFFAIVCQSLLLLSLCVDTFVVFCCLLFLCPVVASQQKQKRHATWSCLTSCCTTPDDEGKTAVHITD